MLICHWKRGTSSKSLFNMQDGTVRLHRETNDAYVNSSPRSSDGRVFGTVSGKSHEWMKRVDGERLTNGSAYTALVACNWSLQQGYDFTELGSAGFQKGRFFLSISISSVAFHLLFDLTTAFFGPLCLFDFCSFKFVTLIVTDQIDLFGLKQLSTVAHNYSDIN